MIPEKEMAEVKKALKKALAIIEAHEVKVVKFSPRRLTHKERLQKFSVYK